MTALKTNILRKLAVLLIWGFPLFSINLAVAQDLDDDPGYVDFVEIEEIFGITPEFEVNIVGKVLKLVAEASREDDPEFAELLHRLRAIQVRSFPLRTAQIRLMEDHSKEIGDELKDSGWNTVVRMRDYGQFVDVYSLESSEYIQGLMMMVVDANSKEAVMINIVGDIQAEELGRIGSKFDIAPLSEIMGQ